jgi:hypothetical protein
MAKFLSVCPASGADVTGDGHILRNRLLIEEFFGIIYSGKRLQRNSFCRRRLTGTQEAPS